MRKKSCFYTVSLITATSKINFTKKRKESSKICCGITTTNFTEKYSIRVKKLITRKKKKDCNCKAVL